MADIDPFITDVQVILKPHEVRQVYAALMAAEAVMIDSAYHMAIREALRFMKAAMRPDEASVDG